jgi:hypothetical protein
MITSYRSGARWSRGMRACSRAGLAGLLALAAGTAGAAAGPMDFLFTTGAVPSSDASRTAPRTWKFDEFSALRLVPREAGAAPNAHPAQVNGDALRTALASVQITLRTGRTQALFASNELNDLVPAAVGALAGAGPDDDIALLSTSRRDDGVLTTPMSATARLFVRDGALQLIVSETRADVYSGFRATRVVPSLGFGSRAADSGAGLRSAVASPRRGDWLAFDLRSAPNAAPAALGATAAPLPTPAPAPATAARAKDPAFFDEQAERLRGLQRLRDQGLITEAEFQEKRREILKSL